MPALCNAILTPKNTTLSRQRKRKRALSPTSNGPVITLMHHALDQLRGSLDDTKQQPPPGLARATPAPNCSPRPPECRIAPRTHVPISPRFCGYAYHGRRHWRHAHHFQREFLGLPVFYIIHTTQQLAPEVIFLTGSSAVCPCLIYSLPP